MGIIWSMGSDMEWPKVTPLSGVHCNIGRELIRILFSERKTKMTEWQKDRKTERNNEGMTEWQKDRKTEKQKDRKTERKKERDMEYGFDWDIVFNWIMWSVSLSLKAITLSGFPCKWQIFKYTVEPVHNGHPWDLKNVVVMQRVVLKKISGK